MNILYINHYAGSRLHGMEFRPFYLGREWQKKGHAVTVVSASYSHLRHSNPIVKRDFDTELEEGIKYVWLKTPQHKGNGIGRLLNILIFVSKLFLYSKKISRQEMPHIVIASSTYPLDVIPALLIGRLTGAKVVHEVHDLWPLTLIKISGISKWNPFVMLLQWAENLSCRKVDRVVSMLEGAFPYLSEHGLTKDRYVVVSNGIVESDWNSDEILTKEVETILDQERSKRHFIVGYAGYMGNANSLETLIRALDALKERKVSLVLVGAGPLETHLKEMVAKNGLENIHFCGIIPKKEIPRFLTKTDANFIGAPKSDLYAYGVSPNKLLDYMMAARPTIYAIESSNNWIADSGGGVVVPAENPQALSNAISHLMEIELSQRIEMGKRAKKFVLDTKTYSNLADKFLEGLV